MKLVGNMTAWLASLAILAVLGPATVNAEELSYSELLTRLEALESQLNQQQTDFASFSMGGAQKADDYYGKGAGCGKGGSCDSGGVYAGYELTYLRPHTSVPLLALGGISFAGDYSAGHRVVIGAENANGIGIRARYWGFDQGNRIIAAGVGTVAQLRVDMDTVDTEITLRERLCNFDLMISGGFRYGRAGFSVNASPQLFFEGYGPTVAIEGTRNLGDRNVYLVGNFRASQLFGRLDVNVPTPVTPIDDEMVTNLESQLGIGWNRDYARASIDARLVWETQSWLNDVIPGTNFGFSGPAFALTVSR